MKHLFITLFIIASLSLLASAQTYSTGDGEWASVMSTTSGANPEPGDNDEYYLIERNDNFQIIHNVYTTDVNIYGISLDELAELTIGDGIDGGSDTLTINGTLITANSSMVTINEGDVIIINGDLRDNREGELIINGTLKVTGDLLNQQASEITVGTNGAILVGGDFTNTNGSTVSNDGTISVGGTYSGEIIGNAVNDEMGAEEALPIELISFNAINSTDGIRLQWVTAIEENNDYFTIERSQDGQAYEVIGTLTGAGNSTSTINYSYTDNNPLLGISYYRLSQTDYDGQSETFDVVSISNFSQDLFSVGPNPATDNITVSLGGEIGSASLFIYNIIGVQVKAHQINGSKATINVSDFPKGTYMVVIYNSDMNLSKRIIIQ